MSGIGEAIHQYENKSDPSKSGQSSVTIPQPSRSIPKEPANLTRVKKAFGTPNIVNFQKTGYSRPTSFTAMQENVHQKQINQLDSTQHTVCFPNSISLEIPKSAFKATTDDHIIGKVRISLVYL